VILVFDYSYFWESLNHSSLVPFSRFIPGSSCIYGRISLYPFEARSGVFSSSSGVFPFWKRSTHDPAIPLFSGFLFFALFFSRPCLFGFEVAVGLLTKSSVFFFFFFFFFFLLLSFTLDSVGNALLPLFFPT